MPKKPADTMKAADLPNLAGDIGEIDGTETKSRPNSRAPVSATRDRPFLIVLAGPGVGEMFPLKQPESIIGRANNATIRINDEGVSRRHARLSLENNQVHILDLGSANGTFVNEE